MKAFCPLKVSLCGMWLLFVIFLAGVCQAGETPRVWNLSKENVFFVGREAKLHEMKSFFNKGNRDILALTGGPGFGKTQVAKKYAHQFCKDYNLIWWIDAQQDIPNQIEKLAIALNHLLSEKDKIIPSTLSKDALIDRVKDILRIKNIPYLLIFDNAESYAQIVKYIPCTHQQKGKHVLLTSRYANIWANKIEIGTFERKESITLIKEALLKEKEVDMDRLAAALSDYPLGLTMAVGFIKTSPTATINKFLSLHMKRTLRRSEIPLPSILDQYSYDALTTLEISLKLIEERSIEALRSLLFMSLLNSKDIPEDYIELWLKKLKSSLTADEAIKYIHDQSLIGVSETTEFNPNRKLEEQERTFYLSAHDLIHQLIREGIPMKEKSQLIESAVEVMLQIFSGKSEVFAKKIISEPVHLLHAQKLCENAKTIGYTSPKLLQLKVCIFECLMGGFRDFEKANLILKEIEEDLRNGIEIEPYYKALYLINKGFFEASIHYEGAIRYMQEGLSFLNSLEGYDEERLRAIANLAQYHTLSGETAKAEQYIQEGLKLFEKSQSEVFNCLFIFGWSLVLVNQGKLQKSLEVLNKVKEYSTLEINYPTVYHSILHIKAETLVKLGRLNEAKEVLEECEEKTKAFFHDRKSTILGNIYAIKGLISILENKTSPQTIQYLTKALSIYDETYKGKKQNKTQARIHLLLGKAYKQKKKFIKAFQEFMASEDIYESLLKEKKIDDVSDLYKELTILGIEMKNEELAQKYLKAHTEIFGLDHPRTKEIFHYLDGRQLAPS